MALIAPRPQHLDRTRRTGCWRVVPLAAILLAAVSSAHAQVVIGGQGRPNVSVDLSVLERLGPPPTLPQLFLTQFGAPSRVANYDAREAPHRPTRVATRRPVARNPHVNLASADSSESPRRVALARPSGIIHLTPPNSRLPAATPALAPATQRPVAHDQIALTQPTRPSVAALTPPAVASAPPAKTPAAPAPQDVPSPPVLSQTPPHDEPPAAPALSQTQSRDGPPAAVTPSVVRQTPPLAPVATSTPTAVTPPPSVVRQTQPATPVAATPAAPPLQMASAASAGLGATSVKFAAGATELPSNAPATLDSVASKLIANDGLRVQLVAHASGTTDQAIEARRVSLARAVAVRAYLIDKGVRSLRVDVRALGNRADNGVAGDQVDLVIVSQ